jgi:hypothetical protein
MVGRVLTDLEIFNEPSKERNKVLCSSNVARNSLFEQIVRES